MNGHAPPRRRLRRGRVLFFTSGVLLCLFYTLTMKARLAEPPRAAAQTGDDAALEVSVRELMASNETQEEKKKKEEEEEKEVSPASTKPPLVIIVNRTDIEQCIYVDPKAPTPPPPPPPPNATDTPHRKGDYPEDLFSLQQRRRGWVSLHVAGMVYMFVALAIVCDEFFVPALEVITNKLQISDDVAGATFMAAGGSAPELFTSLIGVFISHSNVGIGTIVGSAVFNILFVIGMCAIFSREMLHLTWWPLFRDVTFYIVDLLLLIVFFLDNTILWWESLALVLAYVSYVSFMKFNAQIERAVKTRLHKHMSIVKVWTAEEPEKESEAPTAPPSQPPPPPPAAVTPPPPPPPPAAAAAAAASPKAEDKSKREPGPPPSPQSKKPPSDPHEDRMRLRVRPVLQRGGSTASLHNTSLRNTIFQLMIHTLDPMGEEATLRGAVKTPGPRKPRRETSFNGDVRGEGSVQRKAKNKVKPLNSPPGAVAKSHHRRSEGAEHKANTDAAPAGAAGGAAAEPTTSQTDDPGEKTAAQPDDSKGAAAAGGSESSEGGGEDESGDEASSDSGESGDGDDDDDDDEDGNKEEEEEEEENEPLSLEWPDTRRKQATYLVLLPIVFPLWLTLPDVRNPPSRRFFAMTFLGSILWIGVFSYLMVWWAHQVGETIGISEEIMGLTILAAGTSIPDLITSVIVARKGLGDMAVSSSVGSNIFDITVGLPVPWLIYTLLHQGEPVTVSSNGLFCAIVLLFLMLLFVIISIAVCRWKMSRKLGLTMFVLYFVFLVLSVMLEDRILTCPVSI